MTSIVSTLLSLAQEQKYTEVIVRATNYEDKVEQQSCKVPQEVAEDFFIILMGAHLLKRNWPGARDAYLRCPPDIQVSGNLQALWKATKTYSNWRRVDATYQALHQWRPPERFEGIQKDLLHAIESRKKDLTDVLGVSITQEDVCYELTPRISTPTSSAKMAVADDTSTTTSDTSSTEQDIEIIVH